MDRANLFRMTIRISRLVQTSHSHMMREAFRVINLRRIRSHRFLFARHVLSNRISRRLICRTIYLATWSLNTNSQISFMMRFINQSVVRFLISAQGLLRLQVVTASGIRNHIRISQVFYRQRCVDYVTNPLCVLITYPNSQRQDKLMDLFLRLISVPIYLRMTNIACTSVNASTFCLLNVPRKRYIIIAVNRSSNVQLTKFRVIEARVATSVTT